MSVSIHENSRPMNHVFFLAVLRHFLFPDPQHFFSCFKMCLVQSNRSIKNLNEFGSKCYYCFKNGRQEAYFYFPFILQAIVKLGNAQQKRGKF